MELMKMSKMEEVVFGKGFVTVLAAFFTGTEEEIAQLSTLKKSGDRIHMVIDPAGSVTFEGEKTGSSR
ncbi:MAG TPA: hypothetical protein VMT71_01230 [Syntrophorhabdales bacterium]|nr:hypothetical protein [Syntrophorhabdales bacterium]